MQQRKDPLSDRESHTPPADARGATGHAPPAGGAGSRTNFTVRKMTPQDATVLAKAESVLFPDPWRVQDLAAGAQSASAGGYVLCDGDEICGYVLFSRIVPESEILRIGVLPEKQRRHGAALLLDTLYHQGRRAGVRVLFLEVRASNLPARRLYERAGFSVIGVRKAYYRNPTEDAILYRLSDD